MPFLNYFKFIALAAALGLLGACAAPPRVPRYVSPVNVPVAKLAMRATLTGVDGYGVVVYGDNDTCGNVQLAATATRTGEPPVSINLAAGQWATVGFMALNQSRQSCWIRWSFQPVSGRTYLLAGAASNNGCSARLLDATNPDDIKPDPTAVRRNIAGNTCQSIASAQAARSKSTDSVSSAPGKGDATLAPSATTDELKDLIGR
ncbi:MAG: hypothetical protein H7Y33_19055 [Cytophagales bacterium]|nr:hypothetical protein [Rhizobacter sp.]